MADFGDWEQGVTPVVEITPQAYEPAHTTHRQQAAAEGIVDQFDYVEFFGEKFKLAERVGMMPLIAFGNAAKQGLDSDDFEGMAAMYRLIRSVIHRPALIDNHGQRVVDESGRTVRDETEWNRFQELAEDELAEGEDIMGFVNKAMEVMSARPSRRPGISSATSPTTSERSKADSSLPATLAHQAGALTSVNDL